MQPVRAIPLRSAAVVAGAQQLRGVRTSECRYDEQRPRAKLVRECALRDHACVLCKGSCRTWPRSGSASKRRSRNCENRPASRWTCWRTTTNVRMSASARGVRCAACRLTTSLPIALLFRTLPGCLANLIQEERSLELFFNTMVQMQTESDQLDVFEEQIMVPVYQAFAGSVAGAEGGVPFPHITWPVVGSCGLSPVECTAPPCDAPTPAALRRGVSVCLFCNSADFYANDTWTALQRPGIDAQYKSHYDNCAPKSCTYLEFESTVDIVLRVYALLSPVMSTVMLVVGFVYT